MLTMSFISFSKVSCLVLFLLLVSAVHIETPHVMFSYLVARYFANAALNGCIFQTKVTA